MDGYGYGQTAPVEKCGCCDGEAHAEFCDVGVGYVQIGPYACSECGATLDRDGAWKEREQPSDRGERVTGYLILPNGNVFETTWNEDHQYLYEVLNTSRSSILYGGGVRITNLEGYAIELPSFMTDRVRRALVRTLKQADERWGLPYVLPAGACAGRTMSRPEFMALVAGLPRTRDDDLAVEVQLVASP